MTSLGMDSKIALELPRRFQANGLRWLWIIVSLACTLPLREVLDRRLLSETTP